MHALVRAAFSVVFSSLAAMHALKAQGYAYAIVGGVGPAAFYEEAFGAVAIPGSAPGIYAGMMRKA